MIEVKNLLSRFKNIVTSSELKHKAIRDALFSISGISLASKDIVIKGGDVYLETGAIHKNEIFMKQDEIIKELEKILGSQAPKRIR